MTDIQDIFETHADRPFLVDDQGDRTLTYAGFALASQDMAEALERAGATAGSRVTAFLPNGLEMACFYFACMALGAVAVPVNAKYPEQDREYILDVSRADLAVCQTGTLPLIPRPFQEKGRLLKVGNAGEPGLDWTLPREAFEARVRPVRFIRPNLAAAFTLTFTSGTTGRPKGIFHSAETLLSNARSFNQALDVTREHRFLHAMPMAYMAGLLNCLLCPFEAGASVVVCREFDVRLAVCFWETASRHSVNCMWAAPGALSIILQMDRGTKGEVYAREHMRFVASCTASLPESVRTGFRARYGVPVLPSFGLSETLINTIDNPESPCAPGATGYPLPGVELCLGLSGGSRPSPGEEGELHVRSRGQMLGYLDPENGLPIAIPEGGWFATGDMGMILPEGSLRITDRMKDIIVRGGVNVSPKKIEEILLAHGAILEAAVVGVPDALRGEKIVAAIRPRHPQAPKCLERELLAYLRERLEPMAWPEVLLRVDDFPRSSTGKVDKRSLRALLEGA
jgi:long-chain acyl-CoA synthetase